MSLRYDIRTHTKYYGVYNTHKKEFQFNICETSKRKATTALFKKIGNDAYKWKFQIKELKFGNPKVEMFLSKCKQPKLNNESEVQNND